MVQSESLRISSRTEDVSVVEEHKQPDVKALPQRIPFNGLWVWESAVRNPYLQEKLISEQHLEYKYIGKQLTY